MEVGDNLMVSVSVEVANKSTTIAGSMFFLCEIGIDNFFLLIEYIDNFFPWQI